jgi:hypothetical protein
MGVIKQLLIKVLMIKMKSHENNFNTWKWPRWRIHGMEKNSIIIMNINKIQPVGTAACWNQPSLDDVVNKSDAYEGYNVRFEY